MEQKGEGGNFRIDKLTDSNYHIWKRKIKRVLGYRDLEDHIDADEKPPTDPTALKQWKKEDKKTQAIIELTISDDHFKQIGDLSSALETWNALRDLFQRKTLLNKLSARRRFYTAKMGDGETAMSFMSRVYQLADDCQAMDVSIDDKETAMTVLCGLHAKYEHLIVAIDAAADDTKLSMDFVKSRLLQEEQRMSDREDVKPSLDAALVNNGNSVGSSDVVCGYCKKKYHTESTCWKKHPHLRPKRGKQNQTGMVANAPDNSEAHDEESYVCLMAGKMNPTASRASAAEWIIDSGATAHICHDRSMFCTIEDIEPFDISIGDKSGIRAEGRGKVELTLSVCGKSRRCMLNEVLFAPTMGYNMLSVSAMRKLGVQTTFGEDCRMSKGEILLAEGALRGNLYYLSTSTTEEATGDSVALVADLNLWHQRLAHVHVDGIRDMVRNGVVEGVKVDLKKNIDRCKGCVYGKITRAPIPRSRGARATRVLELVHTDVCVKFPVPSLGGSLSFVSFIDDCSRYSWVYPILHKNDVFGVFKKWLAMVEKSHDKDLKVLQSDNGGEYISKEMLGYLENRGIRHKPTTPRNPYQNGVAERLNRTLKELIRSMLHHRSLPKKFWAEALNVAVHVRNRVTTRGLGPKTTPFEVLFGRKPNLSYLRVFGSRCWYRVGHQQVDKLDRRAREAVMIGYARGIRGYKLWDIAEEKVVVSRDVVFDEFNSFYERARKKSVSPVMNSGASSDGERGSELGLDDEPGSSDLDSDLEGTSTQDDHAVDEVMHDADSIADDPEDPDYAPDTDSLAPDPAHEEMPEELQVTAKQIPPEPARRSAREKRSPGEWWKGNKATALISAGVSADPRTFAEALNGPHGKAWMDSMQSEYDSLIENGCWELVPRPPNTNVISSKWVYKTKEEQTEKGDLGTRRKSRMVARGFGQVEGVDYSETYAPVVKLTSIRVLLAIVVILNLILHQMDVITAFLNGDLNELVFMEQPQGFERGNPAEVVCRLIKSIYGLKQAPRQWYAKIDDFFTKSLGMERSPADDCVYVRCKGGQVLVIALYVDDLLIACSDQETLDSTKRELSNRFKMKDLGESRIILGMDICRDHKAGTLSVSQTRYADKVIKRFGMDSARGINTPMDPDLDLSQPSAPCTEPYREAIGSLMYLMVGTRPDLAYPVGVLAKYVEKPTMLHWNAVKRIIRYVIRTKHLGLVYGGTNCSMTPEVYVDADWAGDQETRKSVSGYIAMMSGAAIAWCARQQEVVAQSSAESEYISMCAGAKEVTWLRRLVSGLGVVPDMGKPTVMHVDNQAAMAMARNSSVNRRNKHIDVRYHFTRQAVQDGTLQLQYCPTDEMTADMLTKALGRVKLERFVRSSGLDEAEAASRQLPKGGMLEDAVSGARSGQ